MSTARASNVLATMRDDGSRRWLRPKLSRGRYLTRRRAIGYPLIALFVALPFVRINGRPGLLIDLPRRKLDVFGGVFHATDTVLLMLFMLSVLLGVFFLTALAGRAWCGYACPQSVYMELVFRPLERLLEGRGFRNGSASSGRVAVKLVVFAVLSVALGNVLVAYFVGSDALAHWIHGSPMAAPGPFVAMAVTSVLVFADFAWFREQMCTVACPYARLQSALTDPKSMVVRYDGQRGEPRMQPRARQGLAIVGDCVDCSACVATCPTGIDIRDGAQLECIGCAQCADACDAVMQKRGLPSGLVGYASLPWTSYMRPRLALYGVLLGASLMAFMALARRDRSLDVTVLATSGAPFVTMPDGRIGNTLRLKLVSHATAPRDLTLRMATDEHTLAITENPVRLAADEIRTVNLLVVSDPRSFAGGVSRTMIEVHEPNHPTRAAAVALAGPGK